MSDDENGYEMLNYETPSTSNSARIEIVGQSETRPTLDDIFKIETSLDNHVLPRRFSAETKQGDADDGRRIYRKHGGDDQVHGQHRTTSMHRNAYLKQNVSGRTFPRNLEDRRRWVACSGNTGREPLVEHASKIVGFMQQDSSLMEDGPDSEQMRRDALRNMPQSLAIKKIIKRKLMASVHFSEMNGLGWEKILKYRIAMWFSHINLGLKNTFYSFELWYGSLKKIEGNFGSAVSTYFKFLRWLFVLNFVMMVICLGFIVVPQIVYEPGLGSNATEFSIADLFTGSGYLTNTALYYGFYTNTTIGEELTYDMPHAYFWTMVILYVAPLIILSVRMARSYNKSFIETKGGLKNVFAHKIFCGWDYSIADSKAASLKSTAIYHELKELLNDVDTVSVKVSCIEKFSTKTLQGIANIFVVALLATIGYLMWILLDKHRTREGGDEDSTSVALLTAVVINVIMLFLPILFKLLARYEDYKSPRIILYITMFRTFILEVLIVGILILFWLTQSNEDESCWETSLGQEIYRLIVFDFIFSLFVLELVQYFISKSCNLVEPPEFDIARNTLSLIYNQTLFWVGFLFSPLLGFVVTTKLFLTWYIRRTMLLRFCVPSSKSWRATQMHTWFLILTFLSLLLSIGGHGYIMINVKVSNGANVSCGPFRHLNYIHEVLKLESSGKFWDVLLYIRKPGVIALVIVGLSMFVFYVRAKSKAQIDMVEFLRGRLVLAAQDKEFLLKNIAAITKGQWECDLQEGRNRVVDPRKYAPGDFTLKNQQDNGDAAILSVSSDDLLTFSATSLPTSDADLPRELF